jgi:hypothetical protein
MAQVPVHITLTLDQLDEAVKARILAFEEEIRTLKTKITVLTNQSLDAVRERQERKDSDYHIRQLARITGYYGVEEGE